MENSSKQSTCTRDSEVLLQSRNGFNKQQQEQQLDTSQPACSNAELLNSEFDEAYSPMPVHRDADCDMDAEDYTPSPLKFCPPLSAQEADKAEIETSNIIIDDDNVENEYGATFSDTASLKQSAHDEDFEIEDDEKIDEMDVDDEGYENSIAAALIEQLAESAVVGFKKGPYHSTGPDCDELRDMLAIAIQCEKAEREKKKKQSHLSGVAQFLTQFAVQSTSSEPSTESPDLSVVQNRDHHNDVKLGSQPRRWVYHQEIVKTIAALDSTTFPIRLQDGVLLSELPPPPPHPTQPNDIRKAVRSKMFRCKCCKNRFIEKNLYERHLRERHRIEHLAYLIQQEEEISEQRQAELEANRIEELATGGYIPPEHEIDAESFDVDIEKIPLPGELSGGIPARFDKHGFLRQPRRSYKKKVSPQCPFCDKRFRNEVSLKKHFLKKHSEAVEFVQCLRCFKAVKTKDELPTHECDLTFICFECTPLRNLCTQQRLLNHRAKFHRGANSGFKCNMCSLKFLTPRKLRKHKKMAHVFTKTYPCHFCDELFTSECSVTTHERIHTGIIKFECRICDFKCNRFLWMEDHQKEEHGYICSVCQHKCAEWGALKDHTLQEHGGYLASESNAGYIDSPRVWVMYKGE